MSNERLSLDDFIREYWGERSLLPGDADLFSKLGIDGDDAFDFIDQLADQFAIDMSQYCWYFHHGEEGLNPGGFFFAPPYRRVERMPITPDILTLAIRTRQWPLHYPAHSVPTVRWDVRLNLALATAQLFFVGLWIWVRFVR